MSQKSSQIITKIFIKKQPELESLDLCYRAGLISKEEWHKGLHFRWLYSVIYGLPTVQAYNPNKIKGRAPSKYSEESFQAIREEYKQLVDFFNFEDRDLFKFLINLIIFNYKPYAIAQKIIAKLNKKKTLDKRVQKEEDLIKRAFDKLKSFDNGKKALFFTRRQTSPRITH